MSANSKSTVTLEALSAEQHAPAVADILAGLEGLSLIDQETQAAYDRGEALHQEAHEAISWADLYNKDAQTLKVEADELEAIVKANFRASEKGALKIRLAYAKDGNKNGPTVKALFRGISDACVQKAVENHPEIAARYPDLSGNLAIALLAKADKEGDKARKLFERGDEEWRKGGLGALLEKKAKPANA